MQYVYTAMLLHSAKKEVTEESVKKVLHAAGIESDEAQVKALVASLKSVNIDEAIAQAAVAPVAAHAPAHAAPEAKKEEKKKEKKTEEEAAQGLASLFG